MEQGLFVVGYRLIWFSDLIYVPWQSWTLIFLSGVSVGIDWQHEFYYRASLFTFWFHVTNFVVFFFFFLLLEKFLWWNWSRNFLAKKLLLSFCKCEITKTKHMHCHEPIAPNAKAICWKKVKILHLTHLLCCIPLDLKCQ